MAKHVEFGDKVIYTDEGGKEHDAVVIAVHQEVAPGVASRQIGTVNLWVVGREVNPLRFIQPGKKGDPVSFRPK